MFETQMDKQDKVVELVGRNKMDELQKIWNRSYPRFCSIPYGEEYPKNHTKEEVFKEDAKRNGFTNKEIDLFLSL
jgi:hypothetical protein